MTNAPMIDAGTLCLASSPLPGPVGFVAAPPGPAFDGDGYPGEGLRIVLTPLQLAAIFDNQTIESEGTLGGRLWGGVAVIGGALELVGAAALLLTPEPTLTTKVAGGALGLHGLDTTGAGVRQVISGRPETTFTADGAKAAAMALGADESTAGKIGMGVDLAVPLLLGVAGAARIVAIRRGAISLAEHEGPALGHTLEKHVGQTVAELATRVAMRGGPKVASTFRTVAEAETFIAQALRANRAAITTWARTAAAGERTRVVFDAGRVVGFGVARSSSAVVQMTRLRVVVQKVATSDRVYFILTAFPIP